MLALPSFLLVAAVAVGVYYLPPSLDSARPEVPGRPLQDLGQIPARLWQDPLQAVWNWKPSTLEAEAQLRRSKENLQHRLNDNRRTLILPVLIPGTPYSESHEIRLRFRYAVLSALVASGYAPQGAETIEAFSVPASDRQEESNHQIPAGWLVPFEWHFYEPPAGASNADAYDQVLLLWVDEEFLGTPFLKGLHKVMHALHADPVRPCEDEAGLCVEVIGPSNSTGFKPYLVPPPEEDCSSQKACLLARARLNSARATTWDQSADRFQLPYEIRLQPSIGGDLDLCWLLKDELKLRGVTPSEESQIVLITEMDTVYGRTFPETFRSVFQNVQLRYIHEYTYLRGIDGQIPGTKKKDKAGSKADAEDTSSGVLNISQIERPEGRSQYDYLRRLEQLLKANHDPESIRAIGVTGTDVYDKLLILRALRATFSDTLFFTTDLDVRLLHPSEYDSARNLLVATHFSLGLGKDKALAPMRDQQNTETMEDRFAAFLGTGDQTGEPRRVRHVPLFRDSYQSSVFLAVLAALNPSEIEVGATPSHPRIYEVGRKGGILLNPQENGEQEGTSPFFALAILMISIGISLLRLDMRRLRRDLTEKKREEKSNGNLRLLLLRKLARVVSLCLGWLLLRLLPFAVLTLLAISDLKSRNGEVWAVFEGVSLWPSQFLLLLMIMLAIEFAIWLFKEFEVSKLKMDMTFFNVRPEGWRRADLRLKLPESLSDRIRFCWREFKQQVLTECRLLGTYASAAQDNPVHRWSRTDVRSLWQDYLRRTSPGAVTLRLMLYAVLVLPVTGLIFHWAPVRPFRGELSLWVDQGLMMTALLAIGILLVLVCDVTFFTSLFTYKLAGRESLWPKATVAAYSKKGWPEESYTGELINEWLDVQFIGRHTKTIGSFIYFPFILLLLYGVAHHPVFDNWVIRPQEALIFLGAMALAGLPLFMMRRSAISARQQAVQRLNVKTMEAQGQSDSGPRLKILQRCQDDIDSIRQGAFSSLADNPLLRAALIPFGGMGTLALLEFLLL